MSTVVCRSVVGYGRTRTMGTSAQNQIMSNCKNTLTGFKLLVGRKFSDPVVQQEITDLPYHVEELPRNKIGIKVCLAVPPHSRSGVCYSHMLVSNCCTTAHYESYNDYEKKSTCG